MVDISREQYAALHGPTTGDQVRLGDTDLWIEVEQDLTFGGEEAVFGGGKSIRESMAQSLATSADAVLEQGEAAYASGRWTYVASTTLAPDAAVTIVATATDRPGNAAVKTVSFPAADAP